MTDQLTAAPDAFVDGYVSCLLWCGVMVETEDGLESDANGLHEQYDLYDLPSEVQASIRGDCAGFWGDFGEQIEAAEDEVSSRFSADEQAGHDFYLTRNGHGAGFWDGDWPEPLASALTEGSKVYGESGLMLWGGDDEPEWALYS